MTIFHVWDHDPMDGSMGKDYLACTYANRVLAEAEVARRNEASKARWVKNADNGTNRVHEEWNWKHASMTESEVL